MTAAGSVFAGMSATAAMIAGIAPLAAYKPGDESVTSSTTLQNDDSLSISLAANATYFFVCNLDYEGAALSTGDLQWKWSLPSGATMRYHRLGIDATSSGNPTNGFLSTETANPSGGTGGAGALKGVTMIGSVSVGGTHGNMQLQWAQLHSNVTPTIVHAGSVLVAWQIQ